MINEQNSNQPNPQTSTNISYRYPTSKYFETKRHIFSLLFFKIS